MPLWQHLIPVISALLPDSFSLFADIAYQRSLRVCFLQYPRDFGRTCAMAGMGLLNVNAAPKYLQVCTFTNPQQRLDMVHSCWSCHVQHNT